MAFAGAHPATRPDAPPPPPPRWFGGAYAPLHPPPPRSTPTESHGTEGVMVYDIVRIYTVHEEEEVC